MSSRINLHVDLCLQNPVLARVIVQGSPVVMNNKENQEYWEKVRIPNSSSFKWEKKSGDYEAIEQIVKGMDLLDIQKEIFLYKQIWFRMQLEKLKIPWEDGSDCLVINTKNVIASSLAQNQIFGINLRKEVKIQFEGEEVQDAGGLLREYIVLLVAEIFDSKNELFELTDTLEHYYKVHSKLRNCQQDATKMQVFRLFGAILAKAILERVPICPHLDYTLLNHIIQRQTTIEDIECYDEGVKRKLFNQLIYVKLNDMNSSTAQGFNLGIKEEEQILITNENKEEYIRSLIESHTFKCIEWYMTALLKELHSLIPAHLFSIFEPDELEIIVSGLPFIDVQDWKNNTLYKGEYTKDHEYQIISWFWQIVDTFTPEELQLLLQFSTGCSRTPLEGFSKLESNRNIISPFCIQSVEYRLDQQYPKAHTCFNRLDLPMYHSKDLLSLNLRAILTSQLLGIYGKD